MKEEIVSAEWLKNNFNKKNLVILDSSPEKTVTGLASSVSELYIPNSRIFNIKNNFTNKEATFPNSIPNVFQFEKECQALGINANSEIVIYDNLGIYTSPRVWWMFKLMGHQQVKVLNGGLIEWINKGYETIPKSNLNPVFNKGNFKSNLQKEYIIKHEDVLDNINSKKFLLIDARSKGRFDGTDQEPRKYLKSGCIPGSVNIPYTTLLKDGKFKSNQEIKMIFNEKVNNQTTLVFSCGSGMTACIVLLASEIAYTKSRHLYDGSWTEYADLNNLKTNID